MNNQDPNQEINEVKNQIINRSLLIGSIVGLLAFITSLKFNIQNNYLVFALFDLVVVISFLIISILRNRVPLQIKSGIIILGLFIIALASIFKVGVFADSKVMLILIPIFAMLGYTFKNSLMFYLLAISGFLLLGYLYTNHVISSDVDLAKRALSTSAWINNVLLISIVSVIILLIIRKFYNTFITLISDLKIKNKELEIYRNKLELLVKMRTKELESTNNKLTESNTELEDTIGKLKETQDSLVQSEKMASLGVLATGVAHEINNPLNYIKGGIWEIDNFLSSNLSKEQTSSLTPYIEGIKEGVDRASNIVTSLNEFCSDRTSHTERCNIHSIIDSCISVLQTNLNNRIDIIKDYSSKDFNITFNSAKLHQVVLNILSNAEQAILKKGTIKISTKTNGEKIEVSFEDNGIGIKEEYINKIADPFFTTKDVGKGTGLGLSIATKIIEERGGLIQISSKENKGTNVSIYLSSI